MGAPVAIGSRLAGFEGIITLGLRPNLDDYSPGEIELIHGAEAIYYPTDAFAAHFVTLGKRIFPSLECHLYEGDKIKQTRLFQLLGLPHPRTRVFYGRQREKIRDYFAYPFIAKKPRASARGRGVFLIKKQAELNSYLAHHNPAYIQEYLPLQRDIRVVVIGFEPVCAYWRVPAPGEFRCNVGQGASVDFEGVPGRAIELAVETARRANLDEVGMDIAWSDEKGPLLLEFNVKYGHEGPRLAGMDIREFLARKILAGEL